MKKLLTMKEAKKKLTLSQWGFFKPYFDLIGAKVPTGNETFESEILRSFRKEWKNGTIGEGRISTCGCDDSSFKDNEQVGPPIPTGGCGVQEERAASRGVESGENAPEIPAPAQDNSRGVPCPPMCGQEEPDKGAQDVRTSDQKGPEAGNGTAV